MKYKKISGTCHYINIMQRRRRVNIWLHVPPNDLSPTHKMDLFRVPKPLPQTLSMPD